MPDQIIEGKWEDVVQRQDLRGRHVRVTVIDEPLQPAAGQSWVKLLREWAASHPRVKHVVDDSRESIYGGTVDDPR